MLNIRFDGSKNYLNQKSFVILQTKRFGDINEFKKCMDTRKRVVIGAMELFLRSGIKSVTMNDIASHLGMSKRTIYENFADKDALISECLVYIFTMRDDFYCKLIKDSDSIVDIFVGFIKSGAKFHDDRIMTIIEEIKRLYPVIFEGIVVDNRKRNRDVIVELISRGIEEGYIWKNTNVDLATDLFQGQMVIVSGYEPLRSGRYSFIDIFKTLIITFFRGIMTIEGINAMEKQLNCDEDVW